MIQDQLRTGTAGADDDEKELKQDQQPLTSTDATRSAGKRHRSSGRPPPERQALATSTTRGMGQGRAGVGSRASFRPPPARGRKTIARFAGIVHHANTGWSRTAARNPGNRVLTPQWRPVFATQRGSVNVVTPKQAPEPAPAPPSRAQSEGMAKQCISQSQAEYRQERLAGWGSWEHSLL